MSPEHSTTALALLSAVHSGAGSSLGGAVGGQVYGAWGARGLWRAGVAVAGGGLLLVGAAEAAARCDAAAKPVKKH